MPLFVCPPRLGSQRARQHATMPPRPEEFREAALNIPEELGVQLDTPFPKEPPGGGYGQVFYGGLVSGPGLGRRVAVKIQKASGVSTHEANVLQLLHNRALPNTPPMLPELFGEKAHNGWHYLVMDGDATENGWSEWIHKGNLIDAAGWFELRQANTTGHADAQRVLAERFVQAAVAILFMHAAGYAHHDIKLENTMLVQTDSSFPWGVCVIDLGMACPLAPGASCKNPGGGTLPYLAPEVLVARGWSHGFPADLWSLGITLFSAATGFLPFTTDPEPVGARHSNACFAKVQQAQLNGQSSSTATIFRHFNQTIHPMIPAVCPFSAELTALVDAMLTIDPAKRPSITDTLQLALAWARAVLGPAGTNNPPAWLLAASAAAEAPFTPAAIAEAVASNAPGSSSQHAAAASAKPAAGTPAFCSTSVSSQSTPTPSRTTPSLAEVNAAYEIYEAAMDDAAGISSRSTSGGTVWLSAVSMDEASTGEGEAELQMCSCSSSDGASQPAFTAVSAEEPQFRSLSAEGEPAPKRPRATAVPLLPPRPVRQNAFVLPRTPH
jgi:serine/threonine protein kinase